ncbi:hypothetical protein AXX17_AT3G04660 [Arabidopsis thaliana]|uniref:Major facilitator superfamily (MFS) profile domain-containing protein n=1 Tax=Arabidopsis thaliana TaxID=3702 RepID=A0A178V8G8_ARATH|nr:hypothetical protein AXX17_AT3G04660 [Arabidopsis thaliana]
MEEGLLRHENDRDDRRITACVILSTFVAVCSSFSYGCANGYTSGAETAIMKELDLSMAQAKIGSVKEVENSLHRLRGKDADVSDEAAEIQVMTKMLEEDSKSSFCDMFQKKYRRTLVVGIGLMLIQQLSGASGITYYSNAIFRKAGFSERLGSMIFGVFVIPKALVGLILVDRWGRRPLLLASAVGMSIGSLLIGVSFTLQEMNLFPEFIPVFVFINILVYFGFFAIGIGGLPWIIMSEIFPINIKVSAGSIVALTSWTTGWFVSYGFNFMFEWSAQGTFYIFAMVGGLSLLFIWMLVPETKGQSLEELQASLTGTT